MSLLANEFNSFGAVVGLEKVEKILEHYLPSQTMLL